MYPGKVGSPCSGAVACLNGSYWFGTAPVEAADSYTPSSANMRACVLGFLLDMDASPARMTVFLNGEARAQQCEYDFPKDGRAWYPSVGLGDNGTALHSCAM